MRYSLTRWIGASTTLLIVLCFFVCSYQSESAAAQPATAPEVKNMTYRTIGERSVIALVSSDELEIREGGENIVCKYTKQNNKLRVIVSAMGTTTAKYFDITPQGLVGERGEVYYEPETFQKITAQIQLNTQLIAAVENDDASAIDGLVAKGAMVDSRDNRGTALIIAIKGGLTNAVGALLKNGANPNENDDGGTTPLMLAASWGGGWGSSARTDKHDKIVSLLCKTRPI